MSDGKAAVVRETDWDEWGGRWLVQMWAMVTIEQAIYVFLPNPAHIGFVDEDTRSAIAHGYPPTIIALVVLSAIQTMLLPWPAAMLASFIASRNWRPGLSDSQALALVITLQSAIYAIAIGLWLRRSAADTLVIWVTILVFSVLPCYVSLWLRSRSRSLPRGRLHPR